VNQIETHLERLASLAHGEGGWGYVPDQPAHLEPTCLALLALSLEHDRFHDAIETAWRTVDANRADDGTYRLTRGRQEAAWPTALVLFTQSALGRNREDRDRTASALLSLHGQMPADRDCADLVDIDYKIQGWSWAEGTFSWVEPTAWACLALTAAGQTDRLRVVEGQQLLLDRALDEGGINYGNRRIFGRLTEPQVEPTAVMLLALQQRERTPRVTAALRYLRSAALESSDVEQLSWAKLVFDVYPDFDLDIASRLNDRIVAGCRARDNESWLRPSIMREALTALALATPHRNYFRLSPARASGPSSVVTASYQKPNRAPGRFRRALRALAIEGAGRLRPVPPRAEVHIASVTDYNGDLSDVLRRQYEAFRQRVPLAGKRVVLKPNLVEYHRDKVINTHPNVIAAVIELCQREGAAEVLVAEGPGHCRNVEHLARASGLGDVLAHYGVRLVDLNHDELMKCLNLGRLTGLDHLFFSRTVATADVLISLPKLKTHHWAGATLSLKNLFGTLPGICYGWPKNELHWRGIDNSIVDIALTRAPDLAIVDGIIGMEGDGPLNGTPKELGALVMGCDALAVDATCCRLMRLDPEQLPYLILGRRKKLGLLAEMEIQQLGERIAAVARPFETLPQFRALSLERSA
jgi:uncharacterized protein (DUF362 family)